MVRQEDQNARDTRGGFSGEFENGRPTTVRLVLHYNRDFGSIIITYRAYATMSVSVRLSVCL